MLFSGILKAQGSSRRQTKTGTKGKVHETEKSVIEDIESKQGNFYRANVAPTQLSVEPDLEGDYQGATRTEG